MVVTHLSQILGFLAMEPPASLEASALRDAKAAAFADLVPFTADHTVFGQFDGYRDEEGVADDSRRETFAATRVELDNDRWRDVPFLLRTGKAMAEGRRVVTVTFRDPGQVLLPAEDGDGERPDALVLELGDDPRIALELRVKQPGPTLTVTRAAMELDVDRALHTHGLEAYERLLLDVMHGDHSLFTRADEVELLWSARRPCSTLRPTRCPTSPATATAR